VIVSRRRAVSWPNVAWLIGLAVLAAASQRAIPWWALAAPVVLAGLIPAADVIARPERRSVASAAVVAAVVAVIVLVAPVWRGGDPLHGPPGLLADAPRNATTAGLELARPGDRVFNAQAWGSWLEYAWPGALMYLDSRVELFPASVFAEYGEVSAGRGDWVGILDRWQVALVLVDPKGQPGLAGAVRASSSWRVMVDDEALLAVRSDR
jgi:hypothetical protein